MCATWSGADGTHSIPLRARSGCASFSDTYLGSPGLRKDAFDTSFINNSLIMQDDPGTWLRTITGGNTCQERTDRPFDERYAKAPYVPAAGFGGWYWNSDGMLVGDKVVKFHYRQVKTTDAWEEVGSGVSSQPVSDFNNSVLPSTRVVEFPARRVEGSLIVWGSALVPGAGNEVYIYGRSSKNLNFDRRIFLAKVADKSTLADFSTWKFWTGVNAAGTASWSDSQGAANELPGFVGAAGQQITTPSSSFSVSTFDSGKTFWLVSHELDLSGGDILAYPATTPWGFGQKAITLYNPPEGNKSYPKFLFHYDARVHQGFGAKYPGKVVISYNVNTTAVSIGCGSLNDHDASVYRPRFITVPQTAFNAANAVTINDQLTTEPLSEPFITSGVDNRWYNKSRPYAAPDSETKQKTLANKCPQPPAKKIGLSATPNPDGSVSLSWDNYGRDVWYYVSRRDVTANGPWVRSELWSTTTSHRDVPLTATNTTSRQFAYKIVPWGRGGGAPTFADSTVVNVTATLQKPAAPRGLGLHAGHEERFRHGQVEWCELSVGTGLLPGELLERHVGADPGQCQRRVVPRFHRSVAHPDRTDAWRHVPVHGPGAQHGRAQRALRDCERGAVS